MASEAISVYASRQYIPLKTGDEISKSKLKDFKKDMEKQKKEYEKLQKQAGEPGIEAYLTKLRKDVSDLETQL